MAKLKQGSVGKDWISEAIIRRTNRKRSSGIIRITEYLGADKRRKAIKFEESDSNFKLYGNTEFDIQVDEGELKLDLTNPIDALKFAFAKEMQKIGLFPFEYGNPLLEIIDPNIETTDIITKAERVNEAMNILSSELADVSDMREFARCFGLEHGSNSTVKKSLIILLTESPESFIEMWRSDVRGLTILVSKAKESGEFRVNDYGVIYYGEKQVGVKDDDIIKFLQDEPTIATLLNSKYG